jgi:hypothetical protein
MLAAAVLPLRTELPSQKSSLKLKPTNVRGRFSGGLVFTDLPQTPETALLRGRLDSGFLPRSPSNSLTKHPLPRPVLSDLEEMFFSVCPISIRNSRSRIYLSFNPFQ